MATEQGFTISRVFNAPRALVFKMWADPKHRARWWCPLEVDDPEGAAVIKEVVAPERIVMVARAPLRDDGPVDVINTITFEELDGKTRLTVHARLQRVRDRRSRRGRDAFAAMLA